MNAATITALCTGVVGVLGAVAALVGVLRHQANASAHQPPADQGK